MRPTGDFSQEPSWLDRITKYNNLVVIQTFSKAWGLAAARLGMAYACEEIVALLNKVKPRTISAASTSRPQWTHCRIPAKEQDSSLAHERKEKLVKALSSMEQNKKIYPSRANFLLIEVDNADALYRELVSEGS